MTNTDVKKKYIGKTGPSSILLTIANAATLVPLFSILYIVKAYNENSLVMANFWVITGLIITTQIIKSLSYTLFLHVTHQNAYLSLINIRQDLIKHLRQLPISFFQKRKTGDLTNIINHDVEQVEVYLAHGLPELMSTGALIVASTIALFLLDYRLALSAIAGIPLGLIIMALLNRLWSKDFQIFHKKNDAYE